MNSLNDDPTYVQTSAKLAQVRSRLVEVQTETEQIRNRISALVDAANDPMRQADLLLERRGGFDDQARLATLHAEAEACQRGIEQLEVAQARAATAASAVFCKQQLPAMLDRIKALRSSMQKMIELEAADRRAIDGVLGAGFKVNAGLAAVRCLAVVDNDFAGQVRQLTREIHAVENLIAQAA